MLHRIFQRVELELDGLVNGLHDRVIARGQLDGRRMVHSSGFLHRVSRVNVSASSSAGNFSRNARSAPMSNSTVVTAAALPNSTSGLPMKSFAALSPEWGMPLPSGPMRL